VFVFCLWAPDDPSAAWITGDRGIEPRVVAVAATRACNCSTRNWTLQSNWFI